PLPNLTSRLALLQLLETRRLFDFRLSLDLAHDQRGGARVRFDNLKTLPWAKHRHDLRQAIGRNAVSGHDHDKASIGQPKSGVRIENVRVALAVELDELPGIARRRHRAVAQA